MTSAAHAWMPVSPCGPPCTATPMPTVSRLRITARLCQVVAVLLLGLALAPLLALADDRGRTRWLRVFFGVLIRAFGARLEVHGDASLGVTGDRAGHRGALVVGNHVSWLDILVVNAIRPIRSVAKCEIAAWPVVGWLATRAGTIYVPRERLRALPATVTETARALRAGSLVNVCPEGTTWCGRRCGVFRPALFQAAIDGGVPVRPIALRYRLADHAVTTWPAFVGDETLLESVRRTVSLRGLVVETHVLDEIAPGRAADRRELARLAEAAVRAVVNRPGVTGDARHAVRTVGREDDRSLEPLLRRTTLST